MYVTTHGTDVCTNKTYIWSKIPTCQIRQLPGLPRSPQAFGPMYHKSLKGKIPAPPFSTVVQPQKGNFRLSPNCLTIYWTILLGCCGNPSADGFMLIQGYHGTEESIPEPSMSLDHARTRNSAAEIRNSTARTNLPASPHHGSYNDVKNHLKPLETWYYPPDMHLDVCVSSPNCHLSSRDISGVHTRVTIAVTSSCYILVMSTHATKECLREYLHISTPPSSVSPVGLPKTTFRPKGKANSERKIDFGTTPTLTITFIVASEIGRNRPILSLTPCTCGKPIFKHQDMVSCSFFCCYAPSCLALSEVYLISMVVGLVTTYGNGTRTVESQKGHVLYKYQGRCYSLHAVAPPYYLMSHMHPLELVGRTNTTIAES